MKARLETIANLTIIVTGITMMVLVISRVVGDQERTPLPLRQYQVGEKLAAGFPVDFSQSPQTLLLMLSSKCQYCSESLPFYHDVLSAQQANPRVTRLVALGTEDKASLAQYLTQHGLTFDDVVSVSLDKIKLRGTPTLVLVDRLGTVKAVWPGFITDDQRKQEVLKAMAVPGPA